VTKVAVRRSDRFTGALFAILVQAGFLALLILSRSPAPTPEKLSRELTLFLPRLATPPPPRPATRPAPGSAPPQTPVRAFPPAVIAPAPSAPSTEQLRSLGQSLLGCAPETWSSQTPDQRARCPRPGEGVAIQDAPNLMGTRSQVKDEAHWEAELARKKSPMWVPCTTAADKPHGAAVGFSPLCLLAMASEGALTDPRDWPVYETNRLTPEDFYKIEQAYDAWHKANPKAPGSAERVGVHPE
jgi:hypothetical protein